MPFWYFSILKLGKFLEDDLIGFNQLHSIVFNTTSSVMVLHLTMPKCRDLISPSPLLSKSFISNIYVCTCLYIFLWVNVCICIYYNILIINILGEFMYFWLHKTFLLLIWICPWQATRRYFIGLTKTASIIKCKDWILLKLYISYYCLETD